MRVCVFGEVFALEISEDVLAGQLGASWRGRRGSTLPRMQWSVVYRLAEAQIEI